MEYYTDYIKRNPEWEFVEVYTDAYIPDNTFLFENCFIESTFKKMFDFAFNCEDKQKAESFLSVELFRVFNFIRDGMITECENFPDRIKRKIENGLNESFNLENICEDMNYSKNHIINSFSKKFGITPYQYYIDCKISVAKDYLANTSLAINEISDVLSFSNQQYFSFCFKKRAGCSPRAYRESLKL